MRELRFGFQLNLKGELPAMKRKKAYTRNHYDSISFIETDSAERNEAEEKSRGSKTTPSSHSQHYPSQTLQRRWHMSKKPITTNNRVRNGLVKTVKEEKPAQTKKLLNRAGQKNISQEQQLQRIAPRTRLPVLQKSITTTPKGQSTTVQVGVRHVLKKTDVGSDSPLFSSTTAPDSRTPAKDTNRAIHTARGIFKITDDELKAELEAGTRPAAIAAQYGLSQQALGKRLRRLDQDTLDNVLVRYTEAGEPVLDMCHQIAFLNRATMDILRDAQTPANTKLTAIKRAEAQNELQARIQQIIIGVQETREFQQAVIDAVNEIEPLYPGFRQAFINKLRSKRDLMKAALPPLCR
jgi:hypothetical protein